MNTNYFPLLKARDAEIKVLSTSTHNANVTPIFELQRAPEPIFDLEAARAKSSVTDAAYFLDDIARQWNRLMYVDIHRVAAPAERQSWWRLLVTLMNMRGTTLPLAPVIRHGDSAAAITEAAPLAAVVDKAALRVRLPHANIPALTGEILSVAEHLRIDPQNLTVILDWEDRLGRDSLDDLEAGTEAVIAAASAHSREIITLGTPDCTECKQAGDWDFVRREWWLWLRLAQQHSNLAYGDYALYAPADPVQASPQYGHLRYSYGETLWVHRRSKPSVGGLKAAFKICCDDLTQSAHFSGADFSDADTIIADIASGARKSSGAAGQWREYSLGHHLAMVSAQLASPPNPPPAGTS